MHAMSSVASHAHCAVRQLSTVVWTCFGMVELLSHYALQQVSDQQVCDQLKEVLRISNHIMTSRCVCRCKSGEA